VTLDRIAAAGSSPWVREYAVAARALLAERAREEDAEARLRRFLDDHPRSRFQSDGLAALARVRARAERDLGKVNGVLHEAHVRIAEIGGPIALRCRVLRDGAERYLEVEPILLREFLKARQDALHAEMGGGDDYGAYLLVEAEYKWASLLCEQKSAAADEAAGRAPHGALNQVRKIAARAGLDLPEVRSDIERELGRLLLACGDKEGARGALERARDLAPDPRRREAAADALRRLGTG
jgi:tetratricopeptide (TPR) repeat protein